MNGPNWNTNQLGPELSVLLDKFYALENKYNMMVMAGEVSHKEQLIFTNNAMFGLEIDQDNLLKGSKLIKYKDGAILVPLNFDLSKEQEDYKERVESGGIGFVASYPTYWHYLKTKYTWFSITDLEN